ncbi:MAG: complex I NDUFA9 subunit family protein [Halodesulfurarchaeum sp.]
MQVLVTGGTGFIGTHLCRELADRGHDVTALSRSPEGENIPEEVRTVAGDVRNAGDMERALSGQDAVVNLVALSPLFKPSGGDEMHERVHVEGTRNALQAAAADDVDAFVQMSALGADPAGPTAYIRAKGRAEALVRDGSVPWTIFRPSVVFGEGGEFIRFTKALTTPYVTALPGGGKTRFQPIWVGDLVPLLADAVGDEAHRGEVYEIGGPEVLSLAEVARMVYRAEGRSTSVLSIPMPLAGIGMALADPLPFVPFGRDQFRSLRFDNTTDDGALEDFGRSPEDLTTLSTYLDIS